MEKAKEEFEMAININTKLADAHSGLGLVYFRLGNLNEAYKEFKTAISRYPDYSFAHTGLGYVYYAQNRKRSI